MTRLSVIVTFHNQEQFVDQTITSLRRAAREGIEFIIVDDASTDQTMPIIERAAAELPNTTVFNTSGLNTTGLNSAGGPVGVSAARNFGTAVAAGEWVTYLDGDDFVGPNHYADALAEGDRLGVDYLRTDHTRAFAAAREIHRIPHGPRRVPDNPRNGIAPAHRATSVDFPQPWTSLYHRRLVDRGLLEFPEDLRTCEDRLVTWRLHLQAESFAVVGLSSMFWRREVKGSLTQITDNRQLDFIPAFDRIIAMVSSDQEADRFLPKAIRNYLAMTNHHLNRRDEYSAELMQELITRSKVLVAQLPREVLLPVHDALDANRRRTLRPVMKGI